MQFAVISMGAFQLPSSTRMRLTRSARIESKRVEPYSASVPLSFRTAFSALDIASAAFFRQEADLMKSFMTASSIVIDTDGSEDVKGAFPATAIGFEAFVFVRDAIDIDAEIKRLENEIQKNTALLEASEKKLSNENFISHAKPEAIEKEKGKKAEFEEKIEKAKEHIKLLESF